jgi:hypothetical protein
LRIERTGSFTLYGDPAVIGMDEEVSAAPVLRSA